MARLCKRPRLPTRSTILDIAKRSRVRRTELVRVVIRAKPLGRVPPGLGTREGKADFASRTVRANRLGGASRMGRARRRDAGTTRRAGAGIIVGRRARASRMAIVPRGGGTREARVDFASRTGRASLSGHASRMGGARRRGAGRTRRAGAGIIVGRRARASRTGIVPRDLGTREARVDFASRTVRASRMPAARTGCLAENREENSGSHFVRMRAGGEKNPMVMGNGPSGENPADPARRPPPKNSMAEERAGPRRRPETDIDPTGAAF